MEKAVAKTAKTGDRAERATAARARHEEVVAKSQAKVIFSHALYLGGLASVRPNRVGNMIFAEDRTGIATINPKTMFIHTSLIDVDGGEVANRKIVATVTFAVLGGPAAKGAKDQAVITVRTTDGEEPYFQLNKTSPQSVLARIAPWMKSHGIPSHDQFMQRQAADAQGNAVAAALAAQAHPTPLSIADELSKLAALRDSGVLSHDAAKIRLLEG